jgi:sugar phosphate isomerase/epimerase
MPDQLGMVIARPANFALLDRFGLRRAEFVVFSPSDRTFLEEEIRRRGLAYSAHCPVFREPDYPENPLLACAADTDEARRERTIALIGRNLKSAAELGAEHLVVHIQRPVFFSGDDPNGLTDENLFEAAEASCARLAEMSREAGVPILLENLMDNPHFCRAETYLALFERFPEFGFCLDVGHLDVDARSFGVDFEGFVRALAPHTRAVHLQNSRGGGDNFEGRYWKMPVHPSQNTGDGWRDIVWLLDTVLAANPRCIVNFESVPTDIDYAAEGVRWVRGLLEARGA